MRNLVVFCLLCGTNFIFSQQNIYDSLAHKFYDLNAKEELSYQAVKSDLDSLIVSSKKNYYKHKVQEIDLISGFLEDLIALRDTLRLNNYSFIYGDFGKYSDSLLNQQVKESMKYEGLYDFEKFDYILWNKRKIHPASDSLYKKVSPLNCFVNNELTSYITTNEKIIMFEVVKYLVKDKIEDWLVFCDGNTLDLFVSSKVSGNKDDTKLKDLFVTCMFISDEIGNIFKIEKEFPLFKGYEF